jgi:hypothetical protein
MNLPTSAALVFALSLSTAVACSAATVESSSSSGGASDAALDVTAATTDAAPPGTDAGPVDSGTQSPDSGQQQDASAVCTDCIAKTITWGSDGGRTPVTLQSEIAPCRQYQRSRTVAAGGGAMACSVMLAACGTPMGIGEVERAIAHADVVQALAAPKTPLFGHDSRPVDGTVFQITIAGKSIEVGDACSGSPGCVAIPNGVAALVTLLRDIDAKNDCLMK